MRNKNAIYLISAAMCCFLTACSSKSTDNINSRAENTAVSAAAKTSSAGMPNPWTDTTAAESEKAAGFAYGIPEGATDTIYRILGSQNLVEMDFMLNGDRWTARTKPAKEPEDISGMYFSWKSDSAADTEILPLPGKERRTESDGKHILSALWFDKENSRVYSLSVSAMKQQSLAPAKIIFGPALKK